MIEGDIAQDLVGALYTNSTNLHDIVVMTSHNSFVSSAEGYKIHNQQHLTLSEQLVIGVRGFMLDLHYYDEISGPIYLCHGRCQWNSVESIFQKGHDTFFTPTLFSDWLTQYKNFSDKNPNEIGFVFLESYVKSLDIISTLRAAGLYNKIYTDSLLKPITLGEIRQKQQTLIVVSDYQQERLLVQNMQPTILPGLHPTSDIIETHYALESGNNCEMRDIKDFRADPNSTTKHLFLFNHVAEISNPSVNKPSDIMRRIKVCFAQHSYPNFITVDFVDTESECNVLQMIVQQIALSREKNVPLVDIKPQNLESYSTVKSGFAWAYEHWFVSLCGLALISMATFIGSKLTMIASKFLLSKMQNFITRYSQIDKKNTRFAV